MNNYGKKLPQTVKIFSQIAAHFLPYG